MSEIKLRVPRVYGAIHALASELASPGIAKSQVNKNEGYRYRGIDDVMEVLAPLLARHRLCVLPRVLERSVEQRSGERRSLLVSVCLKVAFDIVSVRDGSMHTIEACGEAIDGGDKATARPCRLPGSRPCSKPSVSLQAYLILMLRATGSRAQALAMQIRSWAGSSGARRSAS
ncbi:MAG: ERF family protein [Sphingomonadales bacterium]|nr:ERF family protein [Sphingomonadales bacterium]